MVKWMLDWDIRWEEAGVTLGTERWEEGAWGCSGGRRWDGEPSTAGTLIQGSHFLLDFWSSLSPGHRFPWVDNQWVLKSGSGQAGGWLPVSVLISITYKHLQPIFIRSFWLGSGSHCHFFLLFTNALQCKGRAASLAAAAGHLVSSGTLVRPPST